MYAVLRRKSRKAFNPTYFNMLLESKIEAQYKLCPNCGIMRKIEKLEMNYKDCGSKFDKLILKCNSCDEQEEIGFEQRA